MNMDVTTSIRREINKIPLQVQFFLKRALIIFLGWKLVYHLVLFPVGVPDRQLTIMTGKGAVYLYSLFIPNTASNFNEKSSILYIGGSKALFIANSCNGLELFVLYVSFLFCIPVTFRRQITFAVFGILGIFVLNSLRCFGLAWLFVNNHSFADFAHHYLFKMIIYGVIFYTWVKFSKKYYSEIS